MQETPFYRDIIQELMQDSVQKTKNINKFLNEIINKAVVNLTPKLNTIDQIILWRIIDNNNSSKLTPLGILNFVNYQIGPTGKIQPLKTKAFDKSRKRLYTVQLMLKNEIRAELALQYKNYE